MIRIENKKTYRGDGVYIGRPSLLGNPFKIGQHGTREEIIQRYRAWLWQQVLVCWCKEPGRSVGCHGDVLESSLLWLNSAGANSSAAAVESKIE